MDDILEVYDTKFDEYTFQVNVLKSIDSSEESRENLITRATQEIRAPGIVNLHLITEQMYRYRKLSVLINIDKDEFFFIDVASPDNVPDGWTRINHSFASDGYFTVIQEDMENGVHDKAINFIDMYARSHRIIQPKDD